MWMLKKMVSGDKNRFQEDGFDLDLTYITPRLIAMGFPAEGAEAMFRNSMVETQRFLETRHGGATTAHAHAASTGVPFCNSSVRLLRALPRIQPLPDRRTNLRTCVL
eukprot:SAG11_NODE_2141_length_3756_cov_1.771124_5_plen_107_part_00